MNGCRYQAIDDVSFRDNGVDHDRAEDVVIFAQVHNHGGCFGHITLHVDGGYRRIGLADVESAVFQAFLQFVHHIPEFFTHFGLGPKQFEPFQVADGDGHWKAFGEDLGTGIITNIVDDGFVSGHEGADGGHGLGESGEVEVDVVLYALVFACSGSCFAKGAEAVSVVHEETEFVLFFQGGDLFQLALIASHAEYSFCDDEDTASALFFDEGGGALKLFFTVFDIVVFEYVAVAGVKTESVDDAGVAFGVIDDDVVAAADGVDGAHYALVSVIEQSGVFLFFKGGQLVLQLFVIVAVSAHHTRAHGGSHAEFCGGFCVDLTYFGVVCKTKIIVEAPNYFFFSAEVHAAAYLTFQFGEGKISMRALPVLTYRPIVLD